MRKTVLYLFLLSGLFASAQSALTVEVSAVTGVSTVGLTVELFGEASGWVFDPVKVNSSGIARFAYVPEGEFTLTVDGTPVGLEKYIDENLVHGSEPQTVSVVLNEAVRTPYALNASLSHNDFTGENSVLLSWNRETDYFFDDFESYEPFAIEFAPWTGHDIDREPAAEITGSYPNRGLQQYATIFNPLTIDPPTYYEYEVLRPYSGKQCVGFVRTRSGNANNDWLISPRIKVGVDNVVSFMAKASEYQPDRFTVCVSTTGTEIKDFIQLTPGNYQTVDYRQWQEIRYSLAAYEGKEVYVAIHCVSQNSFMLMVDDFYVGPSEMPLKARRVSRRSAANPNESFEITLDGTRVGSTENYEFSFENIPSGSHILGVTAKYILTQSPEATIGVDVPSSDNYASLTLRLHTDNGTSPDETTSISLVNLATGKLTQIAPDSDGEALVGSLAKGSYLLDVISPLFDEYSATVELFEDRTIDITLLESITDPFNVIYETSSNEDGTFDVELWWNRDLGFRDSFEDYEDFSQQFGEWTVMDLDKMPTYAFSVGGYLITTPEQRGEVGAMIFNPYATKPVQCSEDGLFIAPDGDKYVMFNSAEQATSNDWLISPTLKIGKDYVLRFTAKSYDEMYPGLFEICALTDKDIASPEALDAFYLTNEWMRYEIPLSVLEGKNIEIAFHHTTRDGWLSFIDDIYVGPAEDSSSSDGASENCTFDIYLNGSFARNVQDSYVKFEALPEGTHKVGIQAVYESGKKSALTETTITVDNSGITLPETETATPEYYNLKGMRLSEPSKGINIIRRGNSTLKSLK